MTTRSSLTPGRHLLHVVLEQFSALLSCVERTARQRPLRTFLLKYLVSQHGSNIIPVASARLTDNDGKAQQRKPPAIVRCQNAVHA